MTDGRALYGLALHGGAGVRPGRDYAEAETHLARVVLAGARRLEDGANALDVVEFAVQEMESSGLYVAGRGSAPNSAGYVELDASIMDGVTRKAGAVGAVRDLVSPIAAARRVMDRTTHVLLTGAGAAAFARAEGLGFVADPATYYMRAVGVEERDIARASGHGTVGAVACDRQGQLAAATSTGGLYGKREGRLGDTAIIGAGTWADDAVAVSCTGIGEAFIRTAAAFDVSARMRYGRASMFDAAEATIASVARLGADGGLIAINRAAEISFAFNSAGMKRARAGALYPPEVGSILLRPIVAVA